MLVLLGSRTIYCKKNGVNVEPIRSTEYQSARNYNTYIIDVQEGDTISIYANGKNNDANVGYSITSASTENNIEVIGRDVGDESDTLSNEYVATKTCKIVVDIFTTRQTPSSEPTQYCKKNGTTLTPTRVDDGLNCNHLDNYSIEVNTNDTISVYGKGNDGYGESAYTMFLID